MNQDNHIHVDFDFYKDSETGNFTCTFSDRVQLLYYPSVKTAIIVVDGEKQKRVTPLDDVDEFLELQKETARINQMLLDQETQRIRQLLQAQ